MLNYSSASCSQRQVSGGWGCETNALGQITKDLSCSCQGGEDAVLFTFIYHCEKVPEFINSIIIFYNNIGHLGNKFFIIFLLLLLFYNTYCTLLILFFMEAERGHILTTSFHYCFLMLLLVQSIILVPASGNSV